MRWPADFDAKRNPRRMRIDTTAGTEDQVTDGLTSQPRGPLGFRGLRSTGTLHIGLRRLSATHLRIRGHLQCRHDGRGCRSRGRRYMRRVLMRRDDVAWRHDVPRSDDWQARCEHRRDRRHHAVRRDSGDRAAHHEAGARVTGARLQVVVAMIEIRTGPRAGHRQAGGEDQCAGEGREGERFHIRIFFWFVCRSRFGIESKKPTCIVTSA